MALDLKAATTRWVNGNRDPSYLYRDSIVIVRYHISTLLTKALNIARTARESHEVYRVEFAGTLAQMRTLRTMAMEADEIPEGLRDRGKTLAFGYSDELNGHLRYMRRLLTNLNGMADATDFLCASLMEFFDLIWEGGMTPSVIRNLAFALRAIDISREQSTERHLSNIEEMINVWPVQMQDIVSHYYEWTQREVQDAMLWTGMVVITRESPDMGKVIDWRLPDREGS